MSGTTISGTYMVGITLSSPATENPATVSDSGRIEVTAASGNGIYGTNAAAWTIDNFGTVTAPSRGVFLVAGGTVTNESSGRISGYRGIEIKGGAGQVTNAGSIGGSNTQGVKLDSGGSVTNLKGGTITGGGSYVAIDIALGGMVSNASGGSITNGVLLRDATDIITNGGVIQGGGNAGVSLLAGGTVINSGWIGGTDFAIQAAGPLFVSNSSSGTIRASSTVAGAGFGISVSGAATITNAGTIRGETALTLSGGGTVSNEAGGVIYGDGGGIGIEIHGTGAVVSNAGSIIGGNAVNLSGAGGTLNNTGLIHGFVETGTGGLVSNEAGGRIYEGIFLGPNGTVVNAGTTDGVFGNYYSSVTNLSGGTILGGGVYLPYGGIVANAAGGVITYVEAGNPNGPGFRNGATINSETITNNGLISREGIADRGYCYITLMNTGTIDTIYSYNAVDFVNLAVNTGTIDSVNGVGVRLAAGGTLVNAGTISGGGTAAVQFEGAGFLMVDPGAKFGGKVVGSGGSALELAIGNGLAGTLPGFGSSMVNFATIVFDSGSRWTLAGQPAGFNGAIYGFAAHDTIDLTGLSETVSDYANGILTLTGDQTVTLHMPGTFTTASFNTAPDAGVGTDVFLTLCFCRGTLIRTPRGEVPVEKLAVGETVATWSGEVQPITWIGAGRVLATSGRRSAATPVIVRKSALADNVPHRDLRVTKGHSFYLDDVLIPVEFLVNHRSILWDDRAQEVDLYHVELASHNVLVANGAPAESYRDDDNRWLFHNANSGWGLPPQTPCAPVLTGGAVVDAVWHRLLHRAGPRPGFMLTEDPDLHLVVDGERLDAVSRHGIAHIFRLPACFASVRIVSRAGSPAELGLARDPRVLGVSVRQIVLRQEGRFRVIEPDDSSLADGFHAYEHDNGRRWTDGGAALPASLFEGFEGPAELVLHVGGTIQYPLFGEAVRAAAA